MRKGFLYYVETLGNKLPHPFWLFGLICLATIMASYLAAMWGLKAVDPHDGQVIAAKNLFSAEGLRQFVVEMVNNFAHFKPLGLVLVMLMGVSIAEGSGLLTSVIKGIAFSVPAKVVIPVVFALGACGNIASDAGVVIIPPLAALVFQRMGKHPVAGLIVGYAAVTAGFTANIFIAGTDVLLAGITTEVASSVKEGMEISPTANWYFMIASTIMLTLVGTWVAVAFTIPRCEGFKQSEKTEEIPYLTSREKKGILWAGIALIIYLCVVSLTIIPAGGILRDPETGSIIPSPFFKGLVPILFLFFAIPGYVYGKVTGRIRKGDDVIKLMTNGVKDLASYIVLVFVLAQFINLFKWSYLDKILAIKGAEFLQSTGFTGPPLFIAFILMATSVNIFIGSGSAKWAAFAPIFVPMLARLNYSPAFVQMIYRVGDSITNCVSPLYVFFPLLLGWLNKYDKKAGVGTAISLLLPYAIIFLVVWVGLVILWWGLDLPIGIGERIHLKPEG